MSETHLRYRQESAPVLTALTKAHARDSVSHGAPTSTLVSTRVWEVEAPPPVSSLKGALVPRVLTGRRRRKLSVEIHRIDSNHGGHKTSYEECIVRLLTPERKHKSRRGRRHDDHDDHDDDDDDDQSTVAPIESKDLQSSNYVSPDFLGWNEKYRMPLRNIAVKGTSRTGVFVQVTLGRMKQTRQLIFDTMEAAEDFRRVLGEELDRENQRNQQKLRVVFDGKSPPEKDEVTFLIEILSGWDLPIGDLKKSDPYVVCTFNGRDIHKTLHISNTLDPIWTVKTGSLFLFTVDPETLFLSEGLLFTVKDYDTFGANEKLGYFYVSPTLIYKARGERWEFKLLPMQGSKKTKIPGYVGIKCRRATEYDIEFMNEHVYKSLKTGGMNKMDLTTEQKGGQGALVSYFRRQTRMTKEGRREYKIRPGPDPKRVEETTWMTRDAIETETYHDSQHWIDVGSGRLGKLFVEILGCEDLPNLDIGGRNKTDAFVALVYEDAVVKTDVVDDCLNPRWLPWTKRAAIFHIHHSSSKLYLGVFDFDPSFHPADDHDLVGRVTVDLANLRPDSIYVLKYDLYTTSRVSDRKRNGTLTLRLRLEIEDERLVLLSNLEPPPDFYVNAKTRKDYRVIMYTCTGKYDTSRYSIQYINSYIEEILLYQHALFYLNDAVMNLFLWRGTYPVNIFGKRILLPVHSFSAFVSLVLVVERPQLFPAWFFGSLGWMMLATMDYRLHTPDPWLNCKDFAEFIWALIFGYSPKPPASIEKNQNAEQAKAFIAQMQKRIEAAEAAAAQDYEENARAQEELEKEMEDIGDTSGDISTNRKGGGFSVDPFKAVLFPVQKNLAMLCKYLRLVRWIVYWEECYLSFWFTLGCFLISIAFLFVPWFFIMKWTSRLIVWSLLGPWMKLLDIFYFHKLKNLSEVELEKKKKAAREKRRLANEGYLSEARIKREKAAKLQSMKTYMFGKFIARVPVLKEDRFKDIPLSESYAVPYKPVQLPLSEIAMQEAGYHRTRLPGQHLVGDMIPHMETVSFTDAPVGQAIKQRKLVDRDAPAGILFSGPESTTQAYIKIGSLVLLSSIITWFAVPFFSGLIDKLLISLQKLPQSEGASL
ncbi:hypothetical protein ACA910_018725 [Epithemia clementina (nom. ined.)]